MNLVERIKGILLQPKSEWPEIEREPGDAGYLFPNYVAIVAAIPAVCTFIGTSLVGIGDYRIGIGLGLIRAVVVLCSLIGRRFCRCLYYRLSCGHVRRKKKSRKCDARVGLCANRCLGCWRLQHHPGIVLSGNSWPVQPLSAAHRHCRLDEASRGQGIDLHNCRHCLRDHRLDPHFWHHRDAVRHVIAGQGNALRCRIGRPGAIACAAAMMALASMP